MNEVTTSTKATQSAQDVRKKGEEALHDAQDAATHAYEAGKLRAEAELTEGKGLFARHVKDIAHAAKCAATDLRQHDQAMMAQWADAAADGMNEAAQGLEGNDIRQIFGKVEDYARRQPAVFLAGVALAGFAAARFAKAARDGAATHAHSGRPTATNPAEAKHV